MFQLIFKKIFGSKNDRFLKSLRPTVAAINKLEPQMQALSDMQFPLKIDELKKRYADGESLDALLPETFALVREASVRALGMRHFDVQLVGGIVLHKGAISEMKTGEGKTLVATLAVVLNALAGKGVHVVTVNDYLARRDAEWMGAVYNFLGLSVGIIVHGLTDEQRQASYNADITYGTNNEFGFDFLRDNMKFYKHHLVQREHFYAIVDEVDSILIDEARTPLIISGAGEKSTDLYARVNAIMPALKLDTHFTMDEKARTVALTDEGVARAEEILHLENLYDPGNISYQHHILQALKATHLFKRDVDYLVNEGQVVIVDEFTGRAMPGRRFSDGLHQALEAKEHVKIESENQTLASITFQNYFRMYDKLAGMTGTADTEAVEFKQIYNLDVFSIPTHMLMVRKDYPDFIYRTKKEKFHAIAEEIKELHRKGQPVLVGTISIENSELLSEMLKKQNIPHNVLNAKQHEQEAAIVAEAGQRGKVTIATNMAGRGTDIKLNAEVLELGGLHILGTERHESRRIDNQLRGRSGRQGDPGSSRFYLSLEDDLLRLFGSERFAGILQKLGMEEGQPIEDKLVSRAIEHAQKRVEAHNFEIRKTLLDYDNVMNQQREVIYALRREAMDADSQEFVDMYLEEILDDIFAPLEAQKDKVSNEEKEVVLAELEDVFCLHRFWDAAKGLPTRADVDNGVRNILAALKLDAGEIYPDVLRYFILEELDRCWKEHLVDMDHLRDGIGLRGYGQRDPKQEYKREGFNMFQTMLYNIREDTFRMLTRLVMRKAAAQQADHADTAEQSQPSAPRQEFKHKEQPTGDLAYSGGDAQARPKVAPKRREEPRVGRNDPCPCGSGKKYKKCCGA